MRTLVKPQLNFKKPNEYRKILYECYNKDFVCYAVVVVVIIVVLSPLFSYVFILVKNLKYTKVSIQNGWVRRVQQQKVHVHKLLLLVL